MNINEERIVAAAVQWKGMTFSIPAPARHHTVMHAMYAAGIPTDPNDGCGRLEYQGFLTSHGRFVNREEAVKIATEARQLDGRVKTGSAYMLFSEDLW